MATPDGFDWEAEGRRLGETFDDLHAIVVLGQDPDATACVALGIARAQSPRRRVALGDLLGDAAPLRGLAGGGDADGLVDSFVYGVSQNRIGVEVPGEGQLTVLPTGTEPPIYEEMLPNPRWRRMASSFREAGALLIIAAPADAPEAEKLVDMMDGAILVGDVVPSNLPVVQVIASVRRPPRTAPARAPLTPQTLPTRQGWSTSRRVAVAAAVVVGLGLAGAGLWLFARPEGGAGRPEGIAGRESTASAPVAVARPAATDSAAGTVAGVAPVNPSDSGAAAGYAVALMNENTVRGAMLFLNENGRNLPASTYAPIALANGTWYRVLAGAYPDSTTADSLLAALHARGLLDARSGSRVRAPFAFLIDSGVAPSAVGPRIGRYVAQGLPVYPLFQSDSTARLYVGAFETPAQSALYTEALRAAGITPVLAYRIGRVF